MEHKARHALNHFPGRRAFMALISGLSLCYPNVIECLLSCQSLIHARLNKLFNKIFRFIRDWVPYLFRFEVICALPYRTKHNCVVLSWKWQATGQYGIGNDAKRPKVTPLIVLIHQNFWRHVIRRPTNTVKVFRLISVRDVRQTEVNQLCTSMTIIKKNVLRLQIPMRDIESVQMTESQQTLSNNFSRVIFRKLIGFK
jgi:hypothetical protein